VRWPLRNQILLPMIAVILAALVGVSLLNAYFSVRHARRQIEQELTQVSTTLAESSFPLSDAVLRQMRGLSGAEFVLTDRRGRVTTASSPEFAAFDAPLKDDSARQIEPPQTELQLVRPTKYQGRRFFHAAVDLRPPAAPTPGDTLHILYPEQAYLQQWNDVVYPPLLIGGAAVLLALGLSLVIASRVTRPLARLERQVDEIAGGRFQSLPVPARNDEVADLSRSVNRMAEMLAGYEDTIRRNEQLRTLGQLGGGIAHQMRNSVTGCRMAVDLHARDCPQDGESLQVARRQLELMQKYLDRFLSLGRRRDNPHVRVALSPLIDSVLSLVGPTARHVDVELDWFPPEEPIFVTADTDALGQLLVNLVLNGIEAAAGGSPPRKVAIALSLDRGRVRIEVADTGPGPPQEIAAELFEPFVTAKPDGTGLGLAVAREIAREHGGDVDWRRAEGTTIFALWLPAEQQQDDSKREQLHVDHVGSG